MELFGIALDEWHVWVLLGVLFFIIEIFTPAFVAACLGIGFLFGGLASALDLSYTWQLIFFSVGTASTFFLVRPFILKIGYDQADKIKTNADSLIGRTGKVTEEINASKASGYVAIDGDNWKAITNSNETIEVGTIIEITDRNSIIVTVKRLNQ